MIKNIRTISHNLKFSNRNSVIKFKVIESFTCSLYINRLNTRIYDKLTKR